MSPSSSKDGATETADARPKKRGRGRPSTPPEVVRRRLLDAAERCFERAPFEAIGIMDIVREAHMSSRSFYQFFENKTDCATALAAERAEAFVADMRRIVTESETSLEVCDRILRTYLEDLPLVVADLQRLPPSANTRIQEVLDAYRQKIADTIVEEITRGMAEGLVDSLPEPMSVMLVLAGIEGMSIRYNTQRRREDLVALHPQILSAIEILFPKWINANQKIR